MRLINFALFILLISIPLMTCIQFNPKNTPSLSHPALEKAVLCGEIEKKNDWAYPIEDKVVFIKGRDKRIYCFVSLKNIQGKHFLEWKWYDPQNKVYRFSKKVKIGKSRKYFEKFIAWDSIFLFKEKENGKWKVAVFLDKDFLTSLEFKIQ